MSRFQKNVISFLFVLLGSFFSECHHTHQKISNPSTFFQFIEAYSSGVISKTDVIKIELTDDLGISHAINKIIKSDIITNDENIKGETFWVNAHTLVFKPQEYLESGKTFHFHFNLGKLVQVPDSVKTFYFNVQTMVSGLEFDNSGLKSYHSQKVRMLYEGTFTTSDYQKPSDIESILKIRFKGQNQKISWNHSNGNTIHHFKVDSLIREEQAEKLDIQWNAYNIKENGTGKFQVIVPGIHEFKVLDSRTTQDSDLSLLIQFSDPIAPAQDLRGLITFGSTYDLRYSIDGSEIKVYYREQRRESDALNNVQLKVLSPIKNIEGKKLDSFYVANISLENLIPAVHFADNGMIMPSNGKLLIPFTAVNLKAVDVYIIKIFQNNIPQFFQNENFKVGNYNADELRRIGKPILQKTIRLDENISINLHKKNRFSLNLDKMIRTEPGAIYRVLMAFKKDYSLVKGCAIKNENTESSENQNQQGSLEDEEGYFSENRAGKVDNDGSFWDLYNTSFPYRTTYGWLNRNNPCDPEFYRTQKWATKNILASNLGLIAKKMGKDQLWVSVNDLLSTKAISGATLEILNYQQQVICSGVSGLDGSCLLNPNQKPFLLVAKRGQERGYLRIGDEDAISETHFDIGGEIVQNGIKGFIYQERDVHRPGDSLYFTFILNDHQNRLPELYPVNFELRNPNGQLVKKAIISHSSDKFYVFRTKTELDAQTGVYSLNVKVGANTFSQDVRIESIMPNRLKIKLDFGGLKQLSLLNHPNAYLSAEWLFGGTAKALKTKVDINLVKDEETTFPKFKDYIFDNPIKPFENQFKTIFDQPLDENGRATIPLDLEMGDQPPSKLKAEFLTKVFEPGGAFSVYQTSIPILFYSSFVGLKAPKGNVAEGGLLMTNTDHTIEIINLDENGSFIPDDRKVNVSLYKLNWHWWWDNNNESDHRFLQANDNQIIKQESVDLNAGKGKWTFRIEDEQWGRYLVLVHDLKSGHQSGKILYLESPDWLTRASTENRTEAARLSLELSKEKYSTGETVQLKFPSTQGGRALVSIESGTKILKTYWIDTRSGQTIFSFPTTHEMSPNVYINVSLLQSADKKNDLPVRMFGVIPLYVENKETILKPKIQIASSIRPETSTNITISESNGNEMTYTLALVDEGLLDITGFETPDPHKSFYSKEALGVETFDLYDDVMGDLGMLGDRELSIGGDAVSQFQKIQKKDPVNQVNRFKPVVLFLGPFHLNEGEKKTHKVYIPQYTGSIRVMVVAGHDIAYGQSEVSVKVKKPLMLLATLPRVLAPYEELNLPVSVFSTDNSIKNALITLEPSPYYEIIGSNTQSIEFPVPGDQLVNFHIKISNKTGIAKIKLLGVSGNENAHYEVNLAIRNPQPYITKVFPYELKKGTTSIPIQSIGSSDLASAYLEVSTLPSINLQKRISYLIDYPHGCAEQITSSAFAQLMIPSLGDFSPKQKLDIDNNIKTAIRKIMGLQLSNGGVSYWPGSPSADEWITSYSGQFLWQAEKKGYSIPEGFFRIWKNYQKNKAQNWYPSRENFYCGDEVQAYRLYTLALLHEPEPGAMNRLLEFDYISEQAQWWLASAYCLTGNKETARKIVNKINSKIKNTKSPDLGFFNSYLCYGTDLRNQAVKLQTLTLLGEKDKASQVLNSIASILSSDNWLSTQETAYSLISISSFCGTNPSTDRIHYSYGINNNFKEVSTSSYISSIPLPYLSEQTDLKINNLNNNHLFIRLVEKGKPNLSTALNMGSNLQNNTKAIYMQVEYTNKIGIKIDPAKLIQGTDFIAIVHLKNIGNKGDYHHMALTEIFPSGWEILNTRLIPSLGETDNAPTLDNTLPTYQDIRDDRVLTYFDLDHNKKADFKVYLNATYGGHFYAPGIYTEAMYDASIHSGTSGRWIDVVPAQKNP